VINAIPALCAHPPGLISTLDLPYTPTANVVTEQARNTAR
jgi:hypothetical protein